LETTLKNVELIIPANENCETLDILHRWCHTTGMPLAFDPEAYALSSSKLESDRLFSMLNVPAPMYWPDCGFPLIAKPSEGSGSEGVHFFENKIQLEKRFPGCLQPKGWVFQEYMEGPSYSLEIVGVPGHYLPLHVTDLEMDTQYDCKRVLAPTQLPDLQVKRFEEISLKIAEAIQLKGLMDVEVILHKGELKVLEIDARFPSQTPTAVFHSTGVNMIELLPPAPRRGEPIKNNTPDGAEVQNSTRQKFFGGDRGAIFQKSPPHIRSVIYEHIKVTTNTIEVCGEHIMAKAGPLHLENDFFGADEAITNYVPGQKEWVATLIITGTDLKEARQKHGRVIAKIRSQFKIENYIDSIPASYKSKEANL
jgi:pyrrolysine biosynthesis protein PylC